MPQQSMQGSEAHVGLSVTANIQVAIRVLCHWHHNILKGSTPASFSDLSRVQADLLQILVWIESATLCSCVTLKCCLRCRMKAVGAAAEVACLCQPMTGPGTLIGPETEAIPMQTI